MNKFIVFALAFVAACALAAQAGRIENPQELEGAKKAFNNNLNFFANLIKNNQEEEKKQLTIKDAFKTTRDQFQKSINANKNAPIPKPMNKEVEVYLHDEADEDAPQDDAENEAPEQHVQGEAVAHE